MLVASEIRSFICICCPLGCTIDVTLDGDGEIESISGFECMLGEQYGREESTTPKRTVCAIVCIEGAFEPLSVKTAAPVDMWCIKDVLRSIRELRLHAPIEMGSTVAHDIGGSGIDLIATKTIIGRIR